MTLESSRLVPSPSTTRSILWKLLFPFSFVMGAIALFVFLFFPAAMEEREMAALLEKGRSIAAMAAFISLRKRIRKFALGGYDGWRLVHVIIGLLAVVTLFVHTGFRLGHNLNMWLMAAFLATSAVGAASGIITAVEHRLLNGPFKGQRKLPRRIPIWLHILAVWPLPVLLIFHILSVYYY